MDKKIALVTGGVGGIGSAICKMLAKQGNFVVANYAIPGTESKFLSNMAAAGLNGCSTALAFGDVTDYDAMGEMVSAIARDHGPVDILVNCAGITRDATFRKMTPEQWHLVIETNLTSVFNVTRHVIDGMCDRGWGRIINISSVEGRQANLTKVSHYITNKHAINGFTKAVAFEYGTSGITCNALIVGPVETDLMLNVGPKVAKEQGITYEEYKGQYAKNTAIKRLITVHEVSAMALLVASEAGAGITGALLDVSGGTSL